MSIEIMNAVWRQSQSTGRARLVLLAIADHQGEIGAWPSVQTLAQMVNASERSVQRDIQELISLGELEVHVRQAPSRGQYKANLYWVKLPGISSPASEVTDGVSEVTNTAPEVTEVGSEVTESRSEVTRVGVLNLKEPLLETLKETNVQFEDFWSVYPRKQGRGKALESFAKAYKKAGPRLIEAAASYAKDPNLPRDKNYIPLPATWLNQERWLDEPLPKRELTADEVKELRSAESREALDRSKEITRRLLEEDRLRAEQVAANPPRRCEHGRVAVVCRTCTPNLHRS